MYVLVLYHPGTLLSLGFAARLERRTFNLRLPNPQVVTITVEIIETRKL
jgi:hypothetical protein